MALSRNDLTSFAGRDHPPIHPSRMDEQWSSGEHLLFWVYSGTASVKLATGEVRHIVAGEGLWVPASIDRTLHTAADSVAIPTLIRPHNAPSAPDELLRFPVPEGWRDWLIQHYVHWVTPITRPGYTQAEMLDIMPRSARRTRLRRASEDAGYVDEPTPVLLPQSPVARLVGRELLRNPALNHTVEEWAALVSSSASTLRRDFSRDTGMTFARWRTRCRLSVAEELIAAGYAIGWVANHVGFNTRNGFTRAFRAEHGRSPSDFTKDHEGARPSHSQRATALCAEQHLGGLFPAEGSQAEHLISERPVPTTFSPPLMYEDENVLLWTYKGASWARVGGKEFQRKRGDAIWLVAGQVHETRSSQDCVDVPIGSLFGADLPTGEPLRATFPPSWETYLLHCSVANYTMLRPEKYDSRHILALFDEQFTIRRSRKLPMPDDPLARASAIEYLCQLSTPAHLTSVPPTSQGLDDVFRVETGMTVSAWQRAARMRAARDLLATGAKPGSVAGRVGYTSLSAFSHAFTRFHGLSPRTYQQREAGTP